MTYVGGRNLKRQEKAGAAGCVGSDSHFGNGTKEFLALPGLELCGSRYADCLSLQSAVWERFDCRNSDHNRYDDGL